MSHTGSPVWSDYPGVLTEVLLSGVIFWFALLPAARRSSGIRQGRNYWDTVGNRRSRVWDAENERYLERKFQTCIG